MNLAEIMRPKTFDEVIGNQHIVIPLKNQLINQKKVSRAYLISGKFGSGKTTIGRLIATAIPNSTTIEIDCSQLSADQIRDLVDTTEVKSLFSKTKVYILDEIQSLSSQGQNALLKILEGNETSTDQSISETNIVFVLLTNEPDKLKKTLVSRCVVYHTMPSTPQEVGIAVNRVAKQYTLSFETNKDFWAIINLAEGSLRSVYSYMEKLIYAANESGYISSEVFHKIIGKPKEDEIIDENLPLSILKKDTQTALSIIKDIRKTTQPYSTLMGVYNYLKAVYNKDVNKVSRELLATISLILANKQVEWEHIEHIVFKYS